ncbi:GNAT family N-acetyltransferase [uncultured Paludibaculum sp.]|uniref:GNAT family N-acetyltransferase n=1 Tax=uncultured Paludibaculum sp. TaxID=1765020 RepID=UPI002AAA679C|nr:GNAT family N-acetyltransferase [uncultured Paludibaculum sp.]
MSLPEFEVWDAASESDRESWIARWRSWPAREVFAHPDYLLLGVEAGERPLCATAKSGERYVLYPFYLRTIRNESGGEEFSGAYNDISSPYGYGGPFSWGVGQDEGLSVAFWQAFGAWAKSQRVVSEVVRLSLFSESLLSYDGETRAIGENVVRSLDVCGDDLWRDYEYKVRKNVKKAHTSGVRVHCDERGDRLDDFLRIYASTMSRRNASQRYQLPRNYFESLHEKLAGQFAYWHAVYNDNVISTELVLISAERVYSFLGGTDSDYFGLRPNDLLKVEIIEWARRLGKKQFVLGGGYTPNDGIYRYKLSFAPTGRVPFLLGCRVFLEDVYMELSETHRALSRAANCVGDERPSFFPAYRA